MKLKKQAVRAKGDKRILVSNTDKKQKVNGKGVAPGETSTVLSSPLVPASVSSLVST